MSDEGGSVADRPSVDGQPEEGGAERRRHLRVPIDLPAEVILASGRSEEGRITNLGPGGAFVEADSRLEGETDVELRFRLPGFREPIQVRGQVRWRSAAGVGVILHSTTAANERAISVYCVRAYLDWKGETGEFEVGGT